MNRRNHGHKVTGQGDPALSGKRNRTKMKQRNLGISIALIVMLAVVFVGFQSQKNHYELQLQEQSEYFEANLETQRVHFEAELEAQRVYFETAIDELIVCNEAEAELIIDLSMNSMHVTVYLQRVGWDEPVLWSYHSAVLTTLGKNWLEDQIGDSPSGDPAKWISLSTSASAPSAGWTEIPTEIAAGGLTRAAGTYASTGDGTWTITYQFTATATHTDVQLTGIQYANAGDNNLLASDDVDPVTLGNGDKLTVVWDFTVT